MQFGAGRHLEKNTVLLRHRNLLSPLPFSLFTNDLKYHLGGDGFQINGVSFWSYVQFYYHKYPKKVLILWESSVSFGI